MEVLFYEKVKETISGSCAYRSYGSMRFCRHYSCSGSNPFCQAVHQQNGESHRKIEILWDENEHGYGHVGSGKNHIHQNHVNNDYFCQSAENQNRYDDDNPFQR